MATLGSPWWHWDSQLCQPMGILGSSHPCQPKPGSPAVRCAHGQMGGSPSSARPKWVPNPAPCPRYAPDSRLSSGGQKMLSGRMTVVSRSGGFSPRSASYRGRRAPAKLLLSSRTTDTTVAPCHPRHGMAWHGTHQAWGTETPAPTDPRAHQPLHSLIPGHTKPSTNQLQHPPTLGHTNPSTHRPLHPRTPEPWIPGHTDSSTH